MNHKYLLSLVISSILSVPAQSSETLNTSLEDKYKDVKLSKEHHTLLSSFFEETNKIYSFSESVKDIFSGAINKSFYYYDNDMLRQKVVDYVSTQLFKNNGTVFIISEIKKIMEYCDFHLLGDILYMASINNESDDFLLNVEFLRKLNIDRFNRFYKLNNCKNLFMVDSLEDVFSNSHSNNVCAFISDKNSEHYFLQLFNECNGNLDHYIDSHYDLPGINSLVRKGLVKSILLPDGQVIVTKRDNPEKKGRFITEQRNIVNLRRILNLDSKDSFIDLKNEEFNKKSHLKLVQPFAVFTDGEEGKIYSLSYLQKGRTLEEVLLTEWDASTRNYHFTNIRSILEHLYENRILWGDMAPRNIIVNEDENHTEYCILDFEKTRILDRPLKLSEKIEHCRGPMCVEEFGAIALREEVEKIFSGYFSPDTWDLETNSPINLENPKRELLAIFKGRGKESFNLGEYNKLELEVMEVRFPFLQNQEGSIAKRFPLNICFKVDHYFGSDYDRKTTEILITAKKYNYLPSLMNILEEALKNMENKLIISDLENSAKGNPFSNKNKDTYEYNLLREIIDQFYEFRDIGEKYYQKLISKYLTRLEFYKNSIKTSLTKNGLELACNNFKAVFPIVNSLLKEANEKFHPSIMLVSGGFSRKELTHGSDLDIALAENESYPGIKEYLYTEIKERLGMEVEFFANIPSSDKIRKYLYDKPDLFLDFSFATIEGGIGDFIDNFKASRKSVFGDDNYLKTVLDYEKSQIVELETFTPLAHIKKSLNFINFVKLLSENKNISIDIDEMDFLNMAKRFLLFYKDNYYFSPENFNTSLPVVELVIKDIKDKLFPFSHKIEESFNFSKL